MMDAPLAAAEVREPPGWSRAAYLARDPQVHYLPLTPDFFSILVFLALALVILIQLRILRYARSCQSLPKLLQQALDVRERVTKRPGTCGPDQQSCGPRHQPGQ